MLSGKLNLTKPYDYCFIKLLCIVNLLVIKFVLSRLCSCQSILTNFTVISLKKSL